MRIALGLEYNGNGFCGWQSQPGGCGLQDCLQHAIHQVAGEPLTVHAAGRTDAGVHALMQVVHFDTHAHRPLTAWVRGVNAFLPLGLRVLWAQQVDEEFHARFSAHQRHYQYLLINRPIAPAIMSGMSGWFHQPLNLGAMQKAAACLTGEHDFSAFRAAECQAKSPVKHLYRADVRRHGDGIIFDFCASAFLHHQVRNMVGALVYIGKGKYSPDWMASLLESRDRTQAPPTFSAGGLYLSGVGYDQKWELPACQRSLIDFVLPLG